MGAGYQGFFSGFKPVDAVLSSPPKFSLLINDTNPVFYYCGAPGSCIGYGMVGVINPSANTSLAHQRQLAEQSTYMLEPGESWPSEGAIPSGVANTTSASQTSSIPTATATPAATTSTAPSSSHSSISGGAIGGIVIGASAVLLAAGVAIWFCGRNSRRQTPHAPAQEVVYAPSTPAQGYSKHMSTVSAYNVPPGYIPSAQSPLMHGSPDPHHEIRSNMGSPLGYSPAPAYGPGHPENM